jgi:hypothetical protein
MSIISTLISRVSARPTCPADLRTLLSRWALLCSCDSCENKTVGPLDEPLLVGYAPSTWIAKRGCEFRFSPCRPTKESTR